MSRVEIYTKNGCIYCLRAKFLLWRMKAKYDEINVTHDANKFAEMRQRSQQRTVPQIFINDQHIGGSDDLAAAKRSGQLKALLNAE